MTRKFSIPHCYLWMTEECQNRGGLFKRYVEGYIRNTHPTWRMIRIEGMKAVCEKKETTDQ